MNHTPARRSISAVLASVVLIVTTVLAVLLSTAGPAHAHGGPGKIEVQSVTPQSDGSAVDVTVRLTFEGDGDPVDAATVTVTGELADAGGTSPAFTPVTLTVGSEAGIFTGRVALPSAGNWTLRITSVEPPASVTAPVAVAAPAGGTATSAPSTTTAASSTTAAVSTTGDTDAGAASETDSSSNPALPAIVAAVVAAVVASGVAVARWRRRPSSGDE